MKGASGQEYVLQWGRNFIVAESMDEGGGARQMQKLQWGRNFIVAERGSAGGSCPDRPRQASMGPQLHRCGK